VRVEHDLETAKDIQRRLLPRPGKVTELDIAVVYQPSHWVSGDYVDALHLADGRALLVIADVCGKGLSAALVSSSLHTMIHACCADESDLQALVTRLNGYLCSHLPDSSFVTLVAVAIDSRSGAIECLNAGHPPAVVIGAQAGPRWLQTERNVALGMMPDASYAVQSTVLEPNELLLMYTDGAFEEFHKQSPSFDPAVLAEHVAKTFRADAHASAGKICDELAKLVALRAGGLLRTDDTTMLVARRTAKRI
jgi:serine phosphatase RsbU (regulator of sigma subunit)